MGTRLNEVISKGEFLEKDFLVREKAKATKLVKCFDPKCI